MGKEKRRRIDQLLLFPIGAKLVIIVTLIVLISLGSITVLVSWLVRQDLQISAEENNFEVNRRSAAEAEYTFSQTRSNVLILIHTITSGGTRTAQARNSAVFFFKQYPHIASVLFTTSEQDKILLINEEFFSLRGIAPALINVFLDDNDISIKRATAGETLILNATPRFTTHLLAMFFPTGMGSAAVLFSPENLDSSFGSGPNLSWMINDSGDILVHTDFENVRSGVNVADRHFIQDIQESSSRSKQFLAENQFIAYTKLNIGECLVITSIEYDKVFEGIAATTKRNIYLTIAVLGFSIMLIWFFSKSISIPIKALAAAAREIEGGIFDIKLPQSKGRDEIKVLTFSFQKMCSALCIFGRFTNREIAIKAMRGQIKLGGVQKYATIFFSDIREFTAKSEMFTKTFGEDASDKIVYWLNDYFSHMVGCVEKTSGTIDKFIGDAVMAHWGAAYTSGNPAQDAYSCVAAALMMRKSLHEMNKEHEKGDPGNPPIRIGCGINTGMVTAGQLGSNVRMEYTVIGDPVNLASRIEALNKPLGTDILISEETWKLVNKRFITEEMPSVTVKGKKDPVRIFAVINAVGIDKGPQTLADVRRLLGIEAPDITKVDVNAHEEKYKIGADP
jgi:adenylate cyclase